MKMIKQATFSSAEELVDLHIIDFNRCNGCWNNNSLRAINTAASWMVGRMGYTIIDIDMKSYPQRSDWPDWSHVGSHEYLGKLFWNCFFAAHNGTLEFSDMPDFSGTLITDDGATHNIFGDIGQISASTFVIEVLPHMHEGDLFIGVPNEHTQIVLEAGVDFSELIHTQLAEAFGISEKVRQIKQASQLCLFD